MKERPILFSAPMVRAILDGTKVQTRRELRGFFPRNRPKFDSESGRLEWFNGDEVVCGMRCPYGRPGDLLWVRETFCDDWMPVDGIQYRADGGMSAEMFDAGCKWRPSIHMPRWASRITLEITGVRVERLQDISRGDAMEEGCPFQNIAGGPDPRRWFADIWESINGPDSWDANPWVWVIEFRRMEMLTCGKS